MELKGTQTEKNIQAAFAGESQARNKYTYYAEQAHKEGKEELGQLFEKMALNETAHARIWFKLLNDGIHSSDENLVDAATGEGYEWQMMYPTFAEQARADGFEHLAAVFEHVADIERQHEETFMKTLAKLSNKPAPAKAADTAPKPNCRCLFCGYTAVKQPDLCPVCEAIGAFEPIPDEN